LEEIYLEILRNIAKRDNSSGVMYS
jgi:hypothetical protein